MLRIGVVEVGIDLGDENCTDPGIPPFVKGDLCRLLERPGCVSSHAVSVATAPTPRRCLRGDTLHSAPDTTTLSPSVSVAELSAAVSAVYGRKCGAVLVASSAGAVAAAGASSMSPGNTPA